MGLPYVLVKACMDGLIIPGSRVRAPPAPLGGDGGPTRRNGPPAVSQERARPVHTYPNCLGSCLPRRVIPNDLPPERVTEGNGRGRRIRSVGDSGFADYDSVSSGGAVPASGAVRP